MASLLSTRVALRVDEAVRFLGEEPRVIVARCWSEEIPGVRINDQFWLLPTRFLRREYDAHGSMPAPVLPDYPTLTPQEAAPFLPWSAGAIFHMLREGILPSKGNLGRRIETQWLRETF